jgi:hypothetical protein
MTLWRRFARVALFEVATDWVNRDLASNTTSEFRHVALLGCYLDAWTNVDDAVNHNSIIGPNAFLDHAQAFYKCT